MTAACGPLLGDFKAISEPLLVAGSASKSHTWQLTEIVFYQHELSQKIHWMSVLVSLREEQADHG